MAHVEELASAPELVMNDADVEQRWQGLQGVLQGSVELELPQIVAPDSEKALRLASGLYS